MGQDWRFLHPSRPRPLYVVSLSTRIFLFAFSSRFTANMHWDWLDCHGVMPPFSFFLYKVKGRIPSRDGSSGRGDNKAANDGGG